MPAETQQVEDQEAKGAAEPSGGAIGSGRRRQVFRQELRQGLQNHLMHQFISRHSPSPSKECQEHMAREMRHHFAADMQLHPGRTLLRHSVFIPEDRRSIEHGLYHHQQPSAHHSTSKPAKLKYKKCLLLRSDGLLERPRPDVFGKHKVKPPRHSQKNLPGHAQKHGVSLAPSLVGAAPIQRQELQTNAATAD